MSAWVEELADRLELLRDAAHNKRAVQAVQRKGNYDRVSTLRKFGKGDRALLRTPGLVRKLEESWTGPWEVVQKCGIVNYKVRKVGNRGKGRVVHINTMKEYNERVERVRRMMVVVEDEEGDLESVGDGRKIVGEGGCEGFNKQQLEHVLDDFRDTLSSSPGLTSLTEMTINTEEGPPVVQHPYRPPESMLAGIKTELESLLDQGTITQSDSAWSSPMIPVKKPDGRVRICVDYRKLNARTTQTQFYMPLLDEILDDIGQSTVVSKMDLSEGFHQMPVKQKDRAKNAFVCPMGKFHLNRMPFGLMNAPAIFQQLMDYRKLNARTTQTQFSMPLLDEILNDIGQSTVVSKMDLSKRFHQMPVKQKDRAKTAFVCPMGKFHLNRMPFGLMNAPAIFQQLMEQVLQDHKAFARPYIDDVIIFSSDWTTHLDHIRRVLEALKRAGLTANPKKCEWGGKHMLYLGHIVGSGKLVVPQIGRKQ